MCYRWDYHCPLCSQYRTTKLSDCLSRQNKYDQKKLPDPECALRIIKEVVTEDPCACCKEKIAANEPSAEEKYWARHRKIAEDAIAAQQKAARIARGEYEEEDYCDEIPIGLEESTDKGKGNSKAVEEPKPQPEPKDKPPRVPMQVFYKPGPNYF